MQSYKHGSTSSYQMQFLKSNFQIQYRNINNIILFILAALPSKHGSDSHIQNLKFLMHHRQEKYYLSFLALQYKSHYFLVLKQK